MAYSFYDPKSWYGGTYSPGSYTTSPDGVHYFNNNPGAWYDRETAGFGSGQSPFNKFVQGRRAEWNRGYDAANATNPDLTVPQYGTQQPLTEQYFRGLFSGLAPSQRGESSSQFGGGRMRWIG